MRRIALIAAATLATSCTGDSGSPNDSVSFKVAGQIENEYLAISIVFTANDATPVASQLVRGQEKANSAIADLRVTPSAAGVETGVYYMQDPRYFRVEGNNWRPRTTIEATVFVPLSPAIDKLVIEPIPGRQGMVTAGTTFDPRVWAVIACQSAAASSYSECPSVLALVASGAVVVPH